MATKTQVFMTVVLGAGLGGWGGEQTSFYVLSHQAIFN